MHLAYARKELSPRALASSGWRRTPARGPGPTTSDCVASSLTAEGIYAALLTGEEVARGILSPGYQAERTSHWLGVKRRHDRLERALQFAPARAAVLPALARVARWRPARRALADWFLAG